MPSRVPYPAIARVYMAAAARGEPPTMAVSVKYGIAHSTAAQWVARARAAGLLAPTTPGKSSARNIKAARVAKALGLEYDDLTRAVKKYAAGDLRIM